MNEYKFRAECLLDVFHFMQKCLGEMESFTTYPMKDGNDEFMYPDVEVSIKSTKDIEYFRSVAAAIEDCHVIEQSLKPIDQYDGERDAIES